MLYIYIWSPQCDKNLFIKICNCKALPATCKDLPALGKAFPATCKDLPALGKALPATCKDLPAVGKAFPATCKDLPAVGKALPATCKDLPALGKAFPATSPLKKHTQINKPTPPPHSHRREFRDQSHWLHPPYTGPESPH
uniref:Uncharacterized protein n=1 Tax=Paramormyrops kingsleyae TaxID=1676925 RepID=A0A3B3QBX7_9TELE